MCCFSSTCEVVGSCWGNESESERGMDEANRKECDQRGWAAGGSPLFDSRPRRKVHPILRPDPESGGHCSCETATAVAEPECVCGTVCKVNQDRMRGAVCPVWRGCPAACDLGILGALPRRKKSSGDRERDTVSRPTAGDAGRDDREGRAARRGAELLPSTSRLTKFKAWPLGISRFTV